jgi:hypothetical protein
MWKSIFPRYAAKSAQKKSRNGGSQEFNREASNRVAKPLGKNPAELDVNHLTFLRLMNG